jgi:hypothetical protein
VRNQLLATTQINGAGSDPVLGKSGGDGVDLIEIDCLFITHLAGVVPGGAGISELVEQTHGELVEEDLVTGAESHCVQELNRNGLHFIPSTDACVRVIVDSKLEEDI